MSEGKKNRLVENIPKRAARKPQKLGYAKPAVCEYGRVEELTQSGSGAQIDGFGGSTIPPVIPG